ncbi:Alpha,alpha-trehalose-phosphate synthase [UDP-forming] 6 [Zea mays]|uniref:Alpha,alpha-trehalose-phosphate synthase [UDP-forming] 6 n=1 Tax=Zea mays TaxID=4577 RepID=A0A317Y343_MAIZE|nr:Alpha,alpha-trehalose-phosphate synthase [UDP-forming] 6 [Zea mays]
MTVKILPVGIDMGKLRSMVSTPETEDAVRRVTEAYKGRRLMVGIDDINLFKGIGLKFLAMEQLLVEHRELRGHAMLVQIAKAMFEAACSGKISCADIFALTASDASYFLSNDDINFTIPVGRYDETVSITSETLSNLPPSFAGFD